MTTSSGKRNWIPNPAFADAAAVDVVVVIVSADAAAVVVVSADAASVDVIVAEAAVGEIVVVVTDVVALLVSNSFVVVGSSC